MAFIGDGPQRSSPTDLLGGIVTGGLSKLSLGGISAIQLMQMPLYMLKATVAISELPNRIDSLGKQLDQTNTNVAAAATSVEHAARGINDAAQGIERVVTMLDVSLPDLSEGATTLRELAEKLGDVCSDLVVELPRTTSILGEIPAELGSVMEKLDSRLERLEGVIGEVNQLVTSVVGFIPGVRRVVKPARPPFRDNDR